MVARAQANNRCRLGGSLALPHHRDREGEAPAEPVNTNDPTPSTIAILLVIPEAFVRDLFTPTTSSANAVDKTHINPCAIPYRPHTDRKVRVYLLYKRARALHKDRVDLVAGSRRGVMGTTAFQADSGRTSPGREVGASAVIGPQKVDTGNNRVAFVSCLWGSGYKS